MVIAATMPPAWFRRGSEAALPSHVDGLAHLRLVKKSKEPALRFGLLRYAG
jgi:hypothetical protein